MIQVIAYSVCSPLAHHLNKIYYSEKEPYNNNEVDKSTVDVRVIIKVSNSVDLQQHSME